MTDHLGIELAAQAVAIVNNTYIIINEAFSNPTSVIFS